MKLEYQLLVTVITFAITIYGFYTSLKAKSVEQSTRMTTLEMQVSFLERNVENNIRRLNDHDEQNKALVAMTEQIKNLTDDVKELKTMIKERN